MDKDNEEYLEELNENNRFFTKQISNGLTHILILWILSKEKIHGYGISVKLNEFFVIFKKCDEKINPAKIYPILKKMEDKGIVESEEGTSNNKKVKYYQITDKGLKLLNFIKGKWSRLIYDDNWREFFLDMTGADLNE